MSGSTGGAALDELAGDVTAVRAHADAIIELADQHSLHYWRLNRWVTGETWYAAHDVAAMLDAFDVRMNKPSWPVNRWLTGMLRLFRPQIEELLQQRDQRVRAWRREHPEVDNVYEDRRLEVTSEIPISVEVQVQALERALPQA